MDDNLYNIYNHHEIEIHQLPVVQCIFAMDMKFHCFFININSVMVSVLTSSVLDRGFEP